MDHQMFTSVLNDVLGPVMRGPSSSHTAGSYHIAVIVRQLLGAEPKKVKISFDKKGSYGSTYVQQGVDQAFATGLMGWKQTDELFIIGWINVIIFHKLIFFLVLALFMHILWLRVNINTA